MKPRPRRIPTLLMALVATLAIGAGAGAVAYSTFSSPDTKTIVRVPVGNAEPTAASTSALTIGEIYRRSYKGVVEITVTSSRTTPFGGQEKQQAQGSGFVYDAAGHIVTNQHVVAGASSISVSLWNGAEFDAELVGVDPSTDIAVLRIDAPKALLEPLRLANSSEVAVGDQVLAFGSPFGLEGTVTSGIVSALHREMTAPNNYTITDTIQTDAAINHGNSGGPLVDGSGRVIGVNAQIESESGGSDGVGFAIPSNTVRSIVRQLIANGEVEHAYLGIRMTPVAGGVAVTEVVAGTPADKAGLEAATGTKLVDGQEQPTGGDVVVAFDGDAVTSAVALQTAGDTHQPGDTVSITVLRDGSRRTVDVTLGVRP